MQTGRWYVIGFVVAFVYFYVYAVNYIRGVRADDVLTSPVKNVQDFHDRIRRQIGAPIRDPLHQMPLPIARQKQARVDHRQLQQPIYPRFNYIYELFG